MEWVVTSVWASSWAKVSSSNNNLLSSNNSNSSKTKAILSKIRDKLTNSRELQQLRLNHKVASGHSKAKELQLEAVCEH